MRTPILRLAFLGLLGSLAVPAIAQETGPCPSVGGAAFTSITESSLAGGRLTPGPSECLFGPNRQVRAAFYPPSLYEPVRHVRVYTGEFGTPSGEQSASRIPVAFGTRFDDLDRSTLDRVVKAAGLGPRDPGPASGPSPAPPAPDPDSAQLRQASYNPTVPATQGVTVAHRVTTRTYDDFDRVTSETVALEDGTTATISYTYWRNGQRKTLTDARGRVTFYEYDGVNRLARVTANQGRPDEHVTTYEYWPDSLLKTLTKPDGSVTSYDYDRADRLTSVSVRKEGSLVLSCAYTYDDNGNRLSQVEVNGGVPETTTYTYDDLDRLETVTYPGGRSVAYGYDAVGNRTSETERDASGVVVSRKVAVFDAANRLRTVTDAVNPANNVTFSYDRNGNVVSKTAASGTSTYVYDVRDLLVETRTGEQVTGRFAYDAFGRRYLKVGDEGIRQYLYDQTSLLEELTDQGVEVAKYDWGGNNLLSLFRLSEPRRYFHFDGLGTVVALTDASGSVVARYHYDAWGNYREPAELDASANRFGFTGYLFDSETQLYFAKARYYDPVIGRFTTQDSFLGELNDPPSLHRYFYANANPLRYVDPSGFAPEDAASNWVFGLTFVQEFLDRASKIPDAVGQGLANIATPGARSDGVVAGPFRDAQARALDVASNPKSSLSTQVEAYERAAKLHVGVVAEELVRPVVEAPGRASAVGVHIEQAQRSNSVVDRTMHGLEAAKAGAEAFTGLLTPFAFAASRATGPVATTTETAALPELGAQSSATAAAEGALAAGDAVPQGLRVLNPHFSPDPTRVLQNITNAQNARLASDPAIARGVLSPSEYQAGQRSAGIARMQYGNAVERMAAAETRASPLHGQLFVHVGGPSRPDFTGLGLAQGRNFDITTPAAIGVHLARPGYGSGLNIVTYQAPDWFRLFPK